MPFAQEFDSAREKILRWIFIYIIIRVVGISTELQIFHKQGTLSHLTSANSQMASINTLGGDSNTRSVDTSSRVVRLK